MASHLVVSDLLFPISGSSAYADFFTKSKIYASSCICKGTETMNVYFSIRLGQPFTKPTLTRCFAALLVKVEIVIAIPAG